MELKGIINLENLKWRLQHSFWSCLFLLRLLRPSSSKPWYSFDCINRYTLPILIFILNIIAFQYHFLISLSFFLCTSFSFLFLYFQSEFISDGDGACNPIDTAFLSCASDTSLTDNVDALWYQVNLYHEPFFAKSDSFLIEI